MAVELPEDLLDERYCALTTTQRVTGRRHTAELRYIPAEGGVHLVSGSGGLTSWCLNLRADPQAVVRIGDRAWLGRAAFLGPDDPRRAEVRRAFAERYGETELWSEEVAVAHVVFTREI